jgi:hypothetical protein
MRTLTSWAHLLLCLSAGAFATGVTACKSEDKSVGSLPSDVTPGGGGGSGGGGGGGGSDGTSLVAPQRCGGTLPVPATGADCCPSGQYCVDDPADTCQWPDDANCTGVCVPRDPRVPLPCGGNDSTPCPDGLECVVDQGLCARIDTSGTCPGVCMPPGSPFPQECGGLGDSACPSGYLCTSTDLNAPCPYWGIEECPNPPFDNCSGLCISVD